jgi:hypothetical protein
MTSVRVLTHVRPLDLAIDIVADPLGEAQPGRPMFSSGPILRAREADVEDHVVSHITSDSEKRREGIFGRGL